MRDFKGGGSFSRGGKGGGGFRDQNRFRSDRDGDSGRPKEMFQATCAKCGKSCEVPFRPNGKKPVFCSNCFQKSPADGSFRPARPSYQSDRPQYGREDGERRSGTDDMQNQIGLLNKKIDTLIHMMKALTPAPSFKEEAEVMEEQESEVEIVKKPAKKAKKSAKK